MIKERNSRKEAAVSPVIGVMLMLVVTIIIAAIVSAFAGGLASSEKKPNQLSIEAIYSLADGMTITHAGGDPIALANVQFMTTPSELFGPDASKFAYIFPKTAINASDGVPVMNSTTGFYYTSALVPGQSLAVTAGRCDDYATDTELSGHTSSNPLASDGVVNANAAIWWPSSDGNKEIYFRAYQFQNPANIGKYFYLDIVDTNGALITRSKVTIAS